MIARASQAGAGGLLAGAAVGLVEATWVLSRAPSGEYLALLVGPLAYSLLGAMLGIGLGAILLLGPRSWRSSPVRPFVVGFVLVGAGLGLWAGSWQVEHTLVFDHGLDRSTWLLLVTAMVIPALAAAWSLPIFLTRTPLKVLLRPRGLLASWLSGMGLCALFSVSPGPLPPDRRPLDQGPQPEELAGYPDILLISLESWRSEAVEGLLPIEAGGLRSLKEESIYFAEHIASSSWYRASLASLMTSQYPAAHGLESPISTLGADRYTLAELLQERGYRTGGFSARDELLVAIGFQQGFEWRPPPEGDNPGPLTPSARSLRLVHRLGQEWRRARSGELAPVEQHRPARAVIRQAQAFMDDAQRRGERYFAWVHLAELSPPYRERAGAPTTRALPGRALAPHLQPLLAERYRDELGDVDRALAELFGWLRAERLWDRTVVVVVGLNGVEHHEHGAFGLADTLYDEQIRTPLLVRLPSRGRLGRVSPWQVGLVDVAPTLALLAGAGPPMVWEGSSLMDEEMDAWLNHPDGPLPRWRPVLAQLRRRGARLEALRAPPWKLIRANAGNPRDLPLQAAFDLRQDPGERSNLSGQLGAREAELSRELREMLARSGAWRTAAPEGPP